MGRPACTEPQCLYKGTIYIYLLEKCATKNNSFVIGGEGPGEIPAPKCTVRLVT